MKLVKPIHRPDYTYWKTPWTERKRPSREELEIIVSELEEYSLSRFAVGRRFKLDKDFQGVPKGTCCTVTRLWPKTTVRWDKWSTGGRGALRKYQSLLFELDICLEII